MLNDIKKYYSFLIKNEEGRGTKNKIFLILIIILALFLINKLFLVNYANSEYFQIYSALSKLLFFKGISPYSKDISSILVNYFSTQGEFLSFNKIIFQLPIYQLIFYLPFSLIPSLNWSFLLWLTINQSIFLLCIVNCIKILKWEPNKWTMLIILGVGLITFFGISNFLAANTSIIQLFFLIMGLKAYFSERYVIAGLLIGLASIDPFNFFIPLFSIIFFLLSRKHFEPIFWSIISIVLLSLGGIVFDSGWILKYFRNIILEGSFFPFIDYNNALLNWISKLTFGSLVNFVPILLLIWILIEYSRLPKQNSNQLFWILSLIICINPFIAMRETNYCSVLYILPLIFIIYLWENRSTGMLKKVIYGIVCFTAVVLPMAVLLFPGTFMFLLNFHSINLINSIILLIVLYWIRWWVVTPYDYLIIK